MAWNQEIAVPARLTVSAGKEAMLGVARGDLSFDAFRKRVRVRFYPARRS